MTAPLPGALPPVTREMKRELLGAYIADERIQRNLGGWSEKRAETRICILEAILEDYRDTGALSGEGD